MIALVVELSVNEWRGSCKRIGVCCSILLNSANNPPHYTECKALTWWPGRIALTPALKLDGSDSVTVYQPRVQGETQRLRCGVVLDDDSCKMASTLNVSCVPWLPSCVTVYKCGHATALDFLSELSDADRQFLHFKHDVACIPLFAAISTFHALDVTCLLPICWTICLELTTW